MLPIFNERQLALIASVGGEGGRVGCAGGLASRIRRSISSTDSAPIPTWIKVAPEPEERTFQGPSSFSGSNVFFAS